MREIIVTADATGATAPVVLDQYQNPASVTYAKTGSGTVQVTLTDPYPKVNQDRKSTRLNSSHSQQSRMPSSA